MPLAPDKGTFTWADVEHVIARTTSGRVPDPLGAIVVESPVRRLSGELFERTEMMRVCAEARRLGIGLHLDGARLFIASAYTGIAPAELCGPLRYGLRLAVEILQLAERRDPRGAVRAP